MIKLFPLFTVLALTGPALAGECPAGTRSIAEDKAAIERGGGAEYLGIQRMPFTDGGAAVFYHRGGLTYISPVVNGCVLNDTYPVGVFKAEQAV